ncbi:rRNA-processing protein EFG1 [Papiliotrema laurentii]|uniref:rRNA-processing protein EFG1 n=1 Tax=Papiliotrema laurentii TaxID=5418 RepID=A0AAD9L836_PAPLA|nr:rRNA-processing protein EFG1 [Papiliotrema laurentii]
MPSAPKAKHSHRRRHDPTAAGTSASTSASGSGSGPKGSKPKPIEQRDGSGVPGISKLKASIRQTKRFLAKENLEPGLRIQTQRRLTALEADLAHAEKRNIEKKNGGKYHMVKFFERQKLLRIIKRLQKAIQHDEADSTSAQGKGKAQKGVRDAETQLHQARVMLNYILHFPNEQKYISLFPPTTGGELPEGDKKTPLPPHLDPGNASPADPSDARRLEILRRIEGMMERKEISATPEKEGRGDKVDVDVALAGAKSQQVGKAKDAQPDEEDDFFENE